MEDDPGAADDERAIELSSIAAIFPELILDPNSSYDATLTIAVSPTHPLKIRFQQSAESGPPLPPTLPTSIGASKMSKYSMKPIRPTIFRTISQ